MADELIDVLIVGAGPVGLFAANDLNRNGITCRIIDKKPMLSDKSKALGIHIRTLDVLKDCGFFDTVLAQGHKVVGAIFKSNGKQIAQATFTNIGACRDFLIDLPQDQTERILYQGLSDKGIAVEWQSELIAIEQQANRVCATIKRQDGGSDQIVANWVIACDGAKSTLRDLLNARFLGAEYEQRWWLADLHIDWEQPEDKMIIYLSPFGPLACFPMGEKRYRIVVTAPDNDINPTIIDIVKVFNDRSTDTAVLSDSIWISAFSIHHRQIQQYRHQRVFFAGDAAHIHSPMGGQGLNTGIQDVYNLVWKLALVQQGFAADNLLDSYHEERFPIGKAVLKKTDIMTKMVLLKNNTLITIRNHLITFLSSFSFLRKALAKDLAELTISYAKSSIVREEGQKTGLKIGEFVPVAALKSLKTDDIKPLDIIAQGTKHHLFFFIGKETMFNEENLAWLKQYNAILTTHLVVADSAFSNAAFPSIWIDQNQAFHKQFSLNDSTTMLVRPDKYIGLIQSPINLVELKNYLNRLFTIR